MLLMKMNLGMRALLAASASLSVASVLTAWNSRHLLGFRRAEFVSLAGQMDDRRATGENGRETGYSGEISHGHDFFAGAYHVRWFSYQATNCHACGEQPVDQMPPDKSARSGD